MVLMDIFVGILYFSLGVFCLKMIVDDVDCGDWEVVSWCCILIGDVVDVDVGEVVEEDEDVDGVGEDFDFFFCLDVFGIFYCWCVFFMILLFLFWNINESWFWYLGYGLFIWMYCVYWGWILLYCEVLYVC